MEEAIKQIGERLKGLRDVLDIPAEELAETCGITLDKYEKIEYILFIILQTFQKMIQSYVEI